MAATLARLPLASGLPVDEMGMKAGLLDADDDVVKPSAWCCGRVWAKLKKQGLDRVVVGASCIATAAAAVAFKVLNYASWNDQPAACTMLDLVAGMASQGAVLCFSGLQRRRQIARVLNDNALPAFWWTSQFFIITTGQENWHEGFRVALIYAGGIFFTQRLADTVDRATSGADTEPDTEVARGGTKIVLFTQKGVVVIELAKVVVGGALIASSFFTDVPYPHAPLYVGTFLIVSPAGIAANRLFRKLYQHREERWGQKKLLHELSHNEPLPWDLQTLRFLGNGFQDVWPLFMGTSIAVGSIVPMTPTAHAALWGVSSFLFFAGTEAGLAAFEEVPILEPTSTGEAPQNTQWWANRVLVAGTGVYLVALAATNPWPNQLMLASFAIGGVGKYGLIRYAEDGFNARTSLPMQKYIRFNTHHRPLLLGLAFYFVESHMNTGSTAVVKYYKAGNWPKIAAAAASWGSYGTMFVSPTPAGFMPPVVLSELARFIAATADGRI